MSRAFLQEFWCKNKNFDENSIDNLKKGYKLQSVNECLMKLLEMNSCIDIIPSEKPISFWSVRGIQFVSFFISNESNRFKHGFRYFGTFRPFRPWTNILIGDSRFKWMVCSNTKQYAQIKTASTKKAGKKSGSALHWMMRRSSSSHHAPTQW